MILKWNVHHCKWICDEIRRKETIIFSFEIILFLNKVWWAHNTIKKQRRFAAMGYGMMWWENSFQRWFFTRFLSWKINEILARDQRYTLDTSLHLFIQTETRMNYKNCTIFLVNCLFIIRHVWRRKKKTDRITMGPLNMHSFRLDYDQS